MTKTWKEVEKRLTLWYNEMHAPATRMSTGMRGEAVEDINWANRFSIEVKTRKSMPGYILKWMKQAVKNCGNKYPIIHWHRDGVHAENDLVIMSADHFRYHMSLFMAMKKGLEARANSSARVERIVEEWEGNEDED